jgi:hypothetical protein
MQQLHSLCHVPQHVVQHVASLGPQHVVQHVAACFPGPTACCSACCCMFPWAHSMLLPWAHSMLFSMLLHVSLGPQHIAACFPGCSLPTACCQHVVQHVAACFPGPTACCSACCCMFPWMFPAHGMLSACCSACCCIFPVVPVILPSGLSCWLQILPLEMTSTPPHHSSQLQVSLPVPGVHWPFTNLMSARRLGLNFHPLTLQVAMAEYMITFSFHYAPSSHSIPRSHSIPLQALIPFCLRSVISLALNFRHTMTFDLVISSQVIIPCRFQTRHCLFGAAEGQPTL